MVCAHCRREVGGDWGYCPFCGARQEGAGPRSLTRSVADQRIAGVCGGIAEYLEVDSTLIRLAWVVLSIVPGAIVGGVLAYLAAWLLMPEPAAAAALRPSSRRRLTRSATDHKIAGVCGGIAEYFGVDSTAIRALWLILSIFPGAVFGGILAYVVAWLVMPSGPAPALAPTPTSGPSA